MEDKYCALLHPALDELVRWTYELLEDIITPRSGAFRSTADGYPWWSIDAKQLWLGARLRDIRRDMLWVRLYNPDDDDDDDGTSVEPIEYGVPRWFANNFVSSFFLRAGALCGELNRIFEEANDDDDQRSALTAGGVRALLPRRNAISPLFNECRVEFVAFAWFDASLGKNEEDTYFLVPILRGVTPATQNNHIKRASSLVDIVKASEHLHLPRLPRTNTQANCLMDKILCMSHPEITNCLVLLSPRSPRSIKRTMSSRHIEYKRLAFLHACIFLACMDEFMLLFLMRLTQRQDDYNWNILLEAIESIASPKPLFWLLMACILDDDQDRLKEVLIVWETHVHDKGIPYKHEEISHLLPPPPPSIIIERTAKREAATTNPMKHTRSNSVDSFFGENNIGYKRTKAFLNNNDSLMDTSSVSHDSVVVVAQQQQPIRLENPFIEKTASHDFYDDLIDSLRQEFDQDPHGDAASNPGEVSPITLSTNSSASDNYQTMTSPSVHPGCLVSFKAPNMALLTQYAKLVYCAIDELSLLSMATLKQLGDSIMWTILSHKDRTLRDFDPYLPSLSIDDLCKQRDFVIPVDKLRV